MTGAKRGGPQPAECIDRHAPVGFTFNGQPYLGLAGDTIVSALAANGVRSLARSRRLQHRRGVLTADRFDPSCLLAVDDEPNVPAAHRLAANGQRVRSQHVWPSLRFDLKSVNQRLARALQPVTALRPSGAAAFLRPAYHRLIAAADIGGRLAASPHGADRVVYRHVDVLVVGGGAAGLAAAAGALSGDASVLVVEAERRLGGWLQLGADSVVAELAASLEGDPRVEIRRNAVVAGLDRDGEALVVAELADGGEELLVVRAGCVVAAHGLVERSLTFSGNDLPGVMTATAARRLVNLWAVRPGERAVVFTANDHGDAAVNDLLRIGVDVVRVVDARRGGGIRRALGGAELEELQLGDGSSIAADLAVVAPGWTVDAALLESAGGRVSYDRRDGRPVAEGRPGHLVVVGALAGDAAPEEVLAHATISGRQAAAAALRGHNRPAQRRANVVAAPGGGRRTAPPQPTLDRPAGEIAVAAVSVGIIDFAEDVTAFELSDGDAVGAARKLSRAAAAPGVAARTRAELADLARRLPAVASLSDALLCGRLTPVHHLVGGTRLGALAGLAHQPVRHSALHEEHLRLGAHFEQLGEWLDVAHYGDESAEREAVAGRVGLRDTSRSALFDLQGDHVVRLVSLLLGDAALPPAGGVAVAEAPIDGAGGGLVIVAACLNSDHWQLRVDQAAAARLEGWLLTLLHIEHRDWVVHVTAVGEALAGVALVGPGSAEVVATLGGDGRPNGTIAALPGPLAALGAGNLWCYQLAGVPVAELRIPAGRAATGWRHVHTIGADLGLLPVGGRSLEGVWDRGR